MKGKKCRLSVLTSVIAIFCLSTVIFTGCGNAEETTSENAAVQEEKTQTEDATVIAAGETLRIPVSEVTSNAMFFPVEVDGTEMEVIAVRDSSNKIRTAFNTCQICYGSGKGYYIQQGDAFICQNCGNHFTVDQVEVESGGCNPWPIFEENKTVTEDAIEISYDFLAESKEIFANWKRSY